MIQPFLLSTYRAAPFGNKVILDQMDRSGSEATPENSRTVTNRWNLSRFRIVAMVEVGNVAVPTWKTLSVSTQVMGAE